MILESYLGTKLFLELFSDYISFTKRKEVLLLKLVVTQDNFVFQTLKRVTRPLDPVSGLRRGPGSPPERDLWPAGRVAPVGISQ